ncbi:hypothetical protein Misp01_67140 [Microtetraspora sp. NBRC 13810]|uniref:C40 family peptidase n=1 Tax=Microtetraspora sp. NBRC 13810 TaxID=3030990 RepID=UPI0024A228BA|nr:C40 family peptidase [Microtetraspora sp. NBRC 13810]GLW11586.1 hypothetical protein Misp01_67140 [Microtetraspora sp. NBRC 13810]
MTKAGKLARPVRLLSATATAVALLLLPPDSAMAEPRPTIPQAQARLEKLNDEVGRIVDRYNLATERWKKAKKDYDRLDTAYKQQRRTVDDLRSELVDMAVGAYQYGDMTSTGALITGSRPEAVLGSLAAMDQMSAGRVESLRAFDEATRSLQDRHDKAKRGLATAETARETLAEARAKAKRMVDEQTKLLRRLGAFRQGDPNSVGLPYTGPASGNARTALEFAYRQIGKPYQFGAVGPGGYDCSGLTQTSWGQAGVTLPRTTWEQWSWGASRRVPLDLDQLQPGDLLFSKGLGHMGMYAGNGKMVHAPRTGDVVKVVDLDDYWWGRLLGAVRP